jgi:hypothetical protein
MRPTAEEEAAAKWAGRPSVLSIIGGITWGISGFLDRGEPQSRFMALGTACFSVLLLVTWMTELRFLRAGESDVARLRRRPDLMDPFMGAAGVTSVLAYMGFIVDNPGHFRPTWGADAAVVAACIVPVAWWASLAAWPLVVRRFPMTRQDAPTSLLTESAG